jgi:hypothetical protein
MAQQLTTGWLLAQAGRVSQVTPDPVAGALINTVGASVITKRSRQQKRWQYTDCQTSPHISPVSRNMAPDRYHWVTGWTEDHSRSYGLREDQAQWYMNKPEPG